MLFIYPLIMDSDGPSWIRWPSTSSDWYVVREKEKFFFKKKIVEAVALEKKIGSDRLDTYRRLDL